MKNIREDLAALCYEQWSDWMKHLFEFGTLNEDGSFTISASQVARWMRRMITPYRKLLGEEKDSDRKEADKILHLMEMYDLIRIGK